MFIFRSGAYESFYDMPLTIDWNLTYHCNYNCSYCFRHDQKFDPGFSSLEQLKSAVNHIAELNRPYYSFTLTGGEPTIHPHFFDLIKYIHNTLGERVNNVMILSNGSRNEELYSKLADLAKKMNLSMVISIHTDHVNVEHIVDLIKKISGNISVSFNLMFNPAKKDFAKEIFQTLFDLRENYPFRLNLKTCLQPPNFVIPDARYTSEDFEWQKGANEKFRKKSKQSSAKYKSRQKFSYNNFVAFENEGRYAKLIDYDIEDAFQKGMFCFKNMFCMHGTHLLKIVPSGLCAGMICRAARFQYNIFEENPYRHEDFMSISRCPDEACSCPTNYLIPKFVDFNEAMSFGRIVMAKQNRLMSHGGGQ